MVKIEELKRRLEKLPQLKKESNLATKFSDYTKKLTQLHDKLLKVYQDMRYAAKVNSNSEYDKKVLIELNKAVRESKKLYREIEEDAQKVQSKATENKVINLGEYATLARNQCDNIWNREIQEIVGKWKKIAGVLKKIDDKGKQEFKKAVREFTLAVNALVLQSIPQNDNEVDQLKAVKGELQSRVVTLELEGSFGKFLEDAAGIGASPYDLLNNEIKLKLDEYKLWDCFRVRLE